jgi:hypothetical protein
MIWKIWMKCEMIWKIWKKDKLNSEMIWKMQKKIVKFSRPFTGYLYGRAPSIMVFTYGVFGYVV